MSFFRLIARLKKVNQTHNVWRIDFVRSIRPYWRVVVAHLSPFRNLGRNVAVVDSLKSGRRDRIRHCSGARDDHQCAIGVSEYDCFALAQGLQLDVQCSAQQ